MQVNDAFDIFQGKIDADPYHILKARHRKNIFADALKTLHEVNDTVPSGSLARSTQLDPIHDVDLIAVFKQSAHPGWGVEGDSAGEALKYTQDRVRELLGDWSSLTRNVVGQTLLRNHVVQCFLDPRFLVEDKGFRGMFAVELMPALRDERDGTLLIPERLNQRWQKADPEWLIAEVKRRQQQWTYFVRMIRLIKFWAVEVHAGIKSLATEVLVLNCLPDPPPGGLSRSSALARFFTAAVPAVMMPIKDPAGHCGVIQPKLDRVKVSGLLVEAAAIADKALAWERDGKHHEAICCWRTIFGPKFPLPPGGCPGLGDGNGNTQGDSGAESGGESEPPNGGGGPGDGGGGDGPSGGGSSGGVRSRPSGSGGPGWGGAAAGGGFGGWSSGGGSGRVSGGSGTSYQAPRTGGTSPARPIKDAPQGQG